MYSDCSYDTELEWNNQYDNYMALFKYMNSQEDWNVKVSLVNQLRKGEPGKYN